MLFPGHRAECSITRPFPDIQGQVGQVRQVAEPGLASGVWKTYNL